MDRPVVVLVFDGYADWEPALVMAQLRDTAKREVLVAGFDRASVTSMGGLRVTPSLGLDEVDPTSTALLLLPGGERWATGDDPQAQVDATLRAMLERKVPIAAICGGTVALARAGVLAGRAHTSNGPDFLAGVVPGYAGHALYRDERAVRDQGVITASGLASVAFARAIFAELGLLPEAKRNAWFDAFHEERIPDGVDPAWLFAPDA